MLTKEVSYDALAILLILEKDLEPKPEPFRLQSNVRFQIQFHEYVTFIETYLGNANLLATPSHELHALIREYRLGDKETATKKLFSAFLKDMAFAVCKELYFAETLGKGATSIVHSVNRGITLGEKEINGYYANGAVVARTGELLHELSCKDYPMPDKISARNAHLFKYAAVCYFLSDLNTFYWSYL